jgi:hypothetical protein
MKSTRPYRCIVAILNRHLMLPLARLRPASSQHQLGLAPMEEYELFNRIEQALHVELHEAELGPGWTLRELAHHAARRLPLVAVRG